MGIIPIVLGIFSSRKDMEYTRIISCLVYRSRPFHTSHLLQAAACARLGKSNCAIPSCAVEQVPCICTSWQVSQDVVFALPNAGCILFEHILCDGKRSLRRHRRPCFLTIDYQGNFLRPTTRAPSVIQNNQQLSSRTMSAPQAGEQQAWESNFDSSVIGLLGMVPGEGPIRWSQRQG